MIEHRMRQVILAVSTALACIASASPIMAQADSSPTERATTLPRTPAASDILPPSADGGVRDRTSIHQIPPYDSAALRIEEHGGGLRIVRGVNGPVVWSQGFLFTSGNLERIVGPSPGALAQARVFSHKHRRGTTNFAIGFGAFVGSLFMGGNNANVVAATVLGVGGGALMFYSHRDLNAASTAVSRAVLLHNTDIPR